LTRRTAIRSRRARGPPPERDEHRPNGRGPRKWLQVGEDPRGPPQAQRSAVTGPRAAFGTARGSE